MSQILRLTWLGKDRLLLSSRRQSRRMPQHSKGLSDRPSSRQLSGVYIRVSFVLAHKPGMVLFAPFEKHLDCIKLSTPKILKDWICSTQWQTVDLRQYS